MAPVLRRPRDGRCVTGNRVARALLAVISGVAAVAALSAHDYPAALLLGAACFYLERRMTWK